MNFTRVLIGALVIAAAILGREANRPAAAAAMGTGVTAVDTDSPAVSTARRAPNAEGAAPRVDVYGNEVEFAVGDYRVDGTGDLYETHSPDTEVTHLGSPGA